MIHVFIVSVVLQTYNTENFRFNSFNGMLILNWIDLLSFI